MREEPFDWALLLAGLLVGLLWFDALLGGLRGTLWAPLLGPWWSFLWLGPLVHALRYRARARRAAGLALLSALALGAGEVVAFGRGWLPWPTLHLAMGAVLIALALRFRPAPGGAAVARRLGTLVVAVLPLPWIPGLPPTAFWHRALHLQVGMTVEDVAGVFAHDHVQNPGAGSGCERTPVREVDWSTWPDREQITFHPFGADADGDGEACSADLCWTWFEDGRLVGFQLSPD